MKKFAEQLALEPRSDSAKGTRRVHTALGTDHPGTCAAAYAEVHVYDWLLR
jgi:hypothetical protein